ncbi:MAG: hypothetical protein RIR43_2491 [Pseudomonadota bacterium]
MKASAWYAQAEAALQAGDFAKALPDLRRAADAGHGGACQRLAQYLLHFESDTGLPEALQRIEQARRVGHPAGAYMAACIALGGRLLACDAQRIAATLMEAARGGLSPARRAVQWLLDEHGNHQRGTDRPDDQEALAAAIASGLQPVALRHLSPEPWVAVAPQLLSPAECQLLIQAARPSLRPSTVHDPSGTATWRDPLRTSSDCSLDPIEEDFLLRWVQARLAATAGCSLVQAEHLVVLHYGPGQEYRPHRDDLGPDALKRHRPDAGQRWRTLCAYLHPVQAGGQTAFPLLGLTVEPLVGSAVVFDNLDAQGVPEPRSLHAGLPVREGQKWLATLWWRQRAYRPW